jgi:hypothetical protein
MGESETTYERSDLDHDIDDGCSLASTLDSIVSVSIVCHVFV